MPYLTVQSLNTFANNLKFQLNSMNYLKHKSVVQLRSALLIIVLLIFGSSGYAQGLVTGRITDSSGAPLSGVSVQVKNAKTGTVTNAEGAYSISAKPTDVLVFSYVGYQSQEETVGTRATIDLSLGSSSAQLSEVVVIGYGTARKRDLTGSITTVAGKEVADKPNPNPISSLQGKVTGLSVVNSGTPGASPDIRIRGTVSIGQVHPLYVVDGILNDNIDFLNPNDIESIEVLKDPSSLAIFGVRGATGAIVITTKKAKAGQTVVNFTTSYGFKKLVDKIKMVDAAGFDLLFKEENTNNSATTPDYSYLTANTDWIDAVTRTGQFSNNSLSISSSSDKNKFNLSLGYIYDQGIIIHQQLKKMTLAIADELKLAKWVKVGFTLNTARTDYPYDDASALDNARKVMPQVSSGTKPFLVQDPYGPDSIMENLYSGLAVGLQNSGVVNPLIQINNEWNKFVNQEYRNVGSIYADINITKDLDFRSTFYADISNIDNRSYSPLYYAYNPVDNTPYLYNQTTQVYENNQTYRKFQQDQILTYNKTFSGVHRLTVTGGFTTYYFGNFNRGGTAKTSNTPGSLPIPDDPRFWYLNNGFQSNELTLATGSQFERTTVSELARAIYNYKNKYFFNASFRNDASSQLPPQNRNQAFWAVGAGWDISKENFMADQNIFDYLKIHGTIGVLGNQSTPNDPSGNPLPYPYYPSLQSGTAAVFGTNVYNAAQPAYQVNPDLHWETVDAADIGIELNAFKNRLHFEATYYNRTTKDLMTYVQRASIGLPDEIINGGSIRNTGEEFLASWNQNFSKDFSINLSGNITFMKNEVVSLASDLPNGVIDIASQNNGAAVSRTAPGHPIASFYGYQQIGIFQSYADIIKSPSESSLGEVRPGDRKYADINGDGVIDASDRTYIGNPSPDFMYGASIAINYKNFTLDIDGAGVYGNEIFRVWNSLESPFQRVNYAQFQLNRWHGPGTSNWEPIISQKDRVNYQGSSYNIEDGSYFRIRNVQLSYSFPQGTLSSIHVRSIRLYANGQNLITWKHNNGYTAEFGGNATSFGYDAAGGAIPMVITFGLNATF
jgi:TonB-linked SusC/RagA family outer membrane protein